VRDNLSQVDLRVRANNQDFRPGGNREDLSKKKVFSKQGKGKGKEGNMRQKKDKEKCEKCDGGRNKVVAEGREVFFSRM